MRAADTYRASRRNACERDPFGEWTMWTGIKPGVYPLKPLNEGRLKAPKPTLPGIIPPILIMMVARGIASGALQAFANKRKVITA